MPPIDFDDHACDILDCAKDVFGKDVTYRPRAGGSFKIRGIFDETFQQIDPDTEQVVASNQPILGIKLKDLPNPPKKGDIVIVKSRKFRVVDSQEDGIAGASLLLHEICEDKKK